MVALFTILWPLIRSPEPNIDEKLYCLEGKIIVKFFNNTLEVFMRMHFHDSMKKIWRPNFFEADIKNKSSKLIAEFSFTPTICFMGKN